MEPKKIAPNIAYLQDDNFDTKKNDKYPTPTPQQYEFRWHKVAQKT